MELTTILIESPVNEMNINQRINLRTRLYAQYGGTYVNTNINGDVSYRSPLLANFRGNTKGHCTKEVQFSKDTAFIADAIEVDGTARCYVTDGWNEDRWDEGNSDTIYKLDRWDEANPKDLNESDYYYAMIYLPSSNIWCYAPIYIDAMEEAKRREAKRREDNILMPFLELVGGL